MQGITFSGIPSSRASTKAAIMLVLSMFENFLLTHQLCAQSQKHKTDTEVLACFPCFVFFITSFSRRVLQGQSHKQKTGPPNRAPSITEVFFFVSPQLCIRRDKRLVHSHQSGPKRGPFVYSPNRWHNMHRAEERLVP